LTTGLFSLPIFPPPIEYEMYGEENTECQREENNGLLWPVTHSNHPLHEPDPVTLELIIDQIKCQLRYFGSSTEEVTGKASPSAVSAPRSA
ncbi:MAG: hypothetical protein DRQ97_12345, partial [Gammaproteobacteria bacterium]